jgi:Leucine-rich repeat (LRR) protein
MTKKKDFLLGIVLVFLFFNSFITNAQLRKTPMLTPERVKKSTQKDTIVAVVIYESVRETPAWLLECKNLKELEIVGDTVWLDEKLSQLTALKTLRIRARLIPNLFTKMYNDENYKKYFQSLSLQEQKRIQDSASVTQQKMDNERLGVNLKLGKLTNVSWLDLSSCYLREVPKTLKNLKNVDTLFLSRNKITLFPKRLRKQKQLSALYLDYNPLEINRFPKLNHLKKLSIAYGKVAKIHRTVKKLKSLQSLGLAGNQVSEVSPKLGKLSNLKQLIFYKNKLDSLPACVYQLVNLSELDVYYNNIKQISPQIKNLTKLTHLYLSYNKISHLPNEIGQLSLLQELYIHHNEFLFVNDAVRQLSNLQVFHAHHNKLNLFPNALLALKKLREIDLNENTIAEVPIEILQLPLLQTFRIAKNLFSTETKNEATFQEISKELDKRKGIFEYE